MLYLLSESCFLISQECSKMPDTSAIFCKVVLNSITRASYWGNLPKRESHFVPTLEHCSHSLGVAFGDAGWKIVWPESNHRKPSAYLVRNGIPVAQVPGKPRRPLSVPPVP